MMGVNLLMVMVVGAAYAAAPDIDISDVVDVKIGDGGNEFEILTLDNMESGDDETEESFNFLISSPKHKTIDVASQEEIYLPDDDPIDNTIDDTLGSDDIIDVVRNFISEKDAMLQVQNSTEYFCQYFSFLFLPVVLEHLLPAPHLLPAGHALHHHLLLLLHLLLLSGHGGQPLG
jgi:hypothetical protein